MSPTPELHIAGEEAVEHIAGSLTCTGCGYVVALEASDTLPVCPACGCEEFKRSPMFAVEDTVAGVPVEPAESEPKGFADLRAHLDAGTFHLAWEDDGETESRQLAVGWSRVGRSGSADIRFDDPTVSRRHALVVLTSEGELRALDDRSLNGLYVNGKRVEWSTLADGDELEIGRYRLFVVAGTRTA
jgi:predicted  nucleic acid-binding Zn-ribbon protein